MNSKDEKTVTDLQEGDIYSEPLPLATLSSSKTATPMRVKRWQLSQIDCDYIDAKVYLIREEEADKTVIYLENKEEKRVKIGEENLLK